MQMEKVTREGDHWEFEGCLRAHRCLVSQIRYIISEEWGALIALHRHVRSECIGV